WRLRRVRRSVVHLFLTSFGLGGDDAEFGGEVHPAPAGCTVVPISLVTRPQKLPAGRAAPTATASLVFRRDSARRRMSLRVAVRMARRFRPARCPPRHFPSSLATDRQNLRICIR